MTGPLLSPGPPAGPAGLDGPGQPDGEEVYAAALAGLPHLTPARLGRLLAGRSSEASWASVLAGEVVVVPGRRSSCTAEQLAGAWAGHARRVDLDRLRAHYRAAGVQVLRLGRSGYPRVLAEGPQPPPVLFLRGTLAAVDHPRVAVIGTRSATHYGQEMAAELGAGLARAGVSVVSGLALGVDGAAHEGALAGAGSRPDQAPLLGVVGSGLDVVYPPSHARLWGRVAGAGGLVSEAPLGAGAEPWRFPWRNRLLAAFADVVVVVECHRTGGSLSTVEAAARRGATVLAVPGSVRSPASEGTNALIAEGCPPARDVDDVLVALELCGARLGGPADTPGGPSQPGRCGDRRPSGPDAEIWAALDTEPTPTEAVLARTGLPLGRL
ncbi:MAG: DNA-processing protein DprA, partial [Acidimicrobiales bacterium]